MKLAQFIRANSERIIAEWVEFARVHLRAADHLDLTQRRDHLEDMLKAIAVDLDKPQTKGAQASKSKGSDDAAVGSPSAANAHGTDRAATGFSPVDVIAEFRALRASVLRLWSEVRAEFNHQDLEDTTRFNEAIDQLLVESMTRYAHDVERAKDMYLGVLGHDLRNPLGAIMMSAAVMMQQGGPEGTHSQTAARIINAGTRMDELIGDLVDFTRSRLGSGIPIVRAEMDMVLVCRQAIDEITAFHPRCTVNFQASGEVIGPWDRGRISQALSNLIGNALQHGHPSSPIDVALQGGVEEVVLTVHNAGNPIPKSQLSDIFSPFKQLEPRPKSSSSRSIGLGLYIVQSIVAAHRGTIAVESTDAGTTFTVRLPRSADDATEPKSLSGDAR